MNKIISPLKPNMQGKSVADLQDGLLFLLDKDSFPLSEADRQAYEKRLRFEREQSKYGSTTRRLVAMFQEKHQLPPSGEVDERTAHALNELLERWELPDQVVEARLRMVSGEVKREDGLLLQSVRVSATHESERSAIRLGESTTDAQGRYAIRYELLPGAENINLRLSVFSEEGRALHVSELVPNAKALEVVNLHVPMTGRPATERRIEGQVVLEHGLPAEKGMKLRLYRREFGGKATFLRETSTLTGGQYAFSYDPGGKAVSLEIRAVKGTSEEIPLSRPLHDLANQPRAVVNLVAPSFLQPLAAEYRRLVGDLEPHVGNMRNLAGARESDERQDLTVLNRATGWDARLIAVAATAERLGADADVKLPQEALYGLLRAGLPSDKLLLAQVNAEVVEQALKKVKSAGVIELTDSQIAECKRQFTTFSNKVRLSIPAPGSQSTYGALLTASGLPQEAQNKFVPVYLNHRGDSSQLWNEARKVGLDEKQISRLQLQGKFAFLAGNNEAMTTRLIRKSLHEPAQLVEQDLHRADMWAEEVFDQAGIPASRRNNLNDEDRRKLTELIPAAYSAEKVEERLLAYTEDMARKVRLSYPTQVVGRVLEKDNADSFKLGSTRSNVTSLIRKAAARGFRFGQTPVATFLKDHPDVMDGIAADAVETTKQQMKALQRVYHITPHHESMPVLMSMGLTSAYDVMAYSEEVFVELYQAKYVELYDKIVAKQEPRLIYRKASQVSSVTYNLFTIAKELESQAPVYAISAPADVRESVRNELIKQFPTMESLFGSMDYCECEHCRSVLSPAAYLVSLLQFIDAEDNKKPYDALIERRPDLPHIPLTCENTHTVLPYIDIVNEILEYYVANEKLEEDAAHDTGEATTTELLAEPQNVIREAYDKLREARYPLHLPFDLWLETVRQFCNYFELPLARVLEVFRKSDKLFAPTQPFDRYSIFLESLGFSSVEAAIFTDPNPLENNKWYELYGFPSSRPLIQDPTNTEHATLRVANEDARTLREGFVCTYFDVSADLRSTESMTISKIDAPNSGGDGQALITLAGLWTVPPEAGDLLVCDAPAVLKSAKTLSRRLGVTYKEIVEIVQTGFVNPKLHELTVLYRLGVTIQDVLFYEKNKGFYEQHKDLLGQEKDSMSDADQKRFDELSVKDPSTQKTGWEVLSEVEGFEQRLQSANTKLQAFGFNAKDWLDDALQNKIFDDILVLADPDAGCNFDLTTLRYANGKPAHDLVFLKINLFVRLWRKLGWSMDELDLALQVFMPKSAPFEAAFLDKQPLQTVLIYLAHLQTLSEKLGGGKQALLKLLTLWADLPGTGKSPLYAQLFLTSSALKSDDVFDHPLGNYLSPEGIAAMAQSRWHKVQLDNVKPTDKLDPQTFINKPKLKLLYDELQEVQYLSYEGVLSDNEKNTLLALVSAPSWSVLSQLLDAVQERAKNFSLLKGHLLALQGAMSLTANEIGLILEAANLSLETAELSLPNVSLLYRYGLLARALKLSVQELIALKQLSGLDPFKPLFPDPLSILDESLDKDYPFTQTLQFVEVVEKVKESSFTVEDLEYLLRHRFDETGKYRTNHEETLVLLKSLAEGVRAIQTEHAIPDSPGELGEDILRQKLGLALSPEVVERFLAMLNGTAEFELLEDVEAQARSFFDNHLKKQKLRLDDEAGFLDEGDYETLFEPFAALQKIAPGDPPDVVSDKQKENEKIERENGKKLQLRHHQVAIKFLPVLQQRSIRQLIIQAITAQTDVDPALAESLLTDERLLHDAESANAPQSLLTAFMGTGERGLTATFFTSADGSGEGQEIAVFADADTGLKDKHGNPLKPTGTNSARLEGYLEVPASGAYRFYVSFEKQGGKAELFFHHLSDPLFLSGPTENDGAEFSEHIELKPGILYHFTLLLRNLDGGEARLLVQGETLPKGRLRQLTLYPLATIKRAERAWLLLTKALQIVQHFGLTEREVRYLLNHSSNIDNLSLTLSHLPLTPNDASSASTETLFLLFLRLVSYARLKNQLVGGTEDLIDVFETNSTGKPENVYSLIAKLTRRDEAKVKAVAKALYDTPTFSSEKTLLRLWEALQVVEQLDVPVASLLAWLHIVSPAGIPEHRFEIARDWKETVKSRFEPEAWLRVAQPIFDKLRQRQRDALVAYIMHLHGFARMEQLYEYFLIDPGMEPVVQTSRIRLAISSVQLFIQRCLLNLETQVPPSAIKAKQWEWMKHYRVWEANCKIFLFPENWLEPEFRDDKTHLFNELEGALLQGDVSSDLVEDAFLTYLRKLDELARLDIVAMHLEEATDWSPNTLHVIGRTHNPPHKYFYRRYSDRMWTPWEPVGVEIESDHLAPVVWRDRLYLFWVTFLEKAQEVKPEGVNPKIDEQYANPCFYENGNKITNLTMSEVTNQLLNMTNKKDVEVQLHWSEYLQGEWKTRESSSFSQPIKKTVDTSFDSGSVFIHVSKDKPGENGEEGGVYIHLGGVIEKSFYLAGRNSTPEVADYFGKLENLYDSANTELSTRYSGHGALKVSFQERLSTEPNKTPPKAHPSILQDGGKYTLLPCNNSLTSLGVSKEAYEGAGNPAKVEAAIKSGLADMMSLMKPVFYQDNMHTFFIEPDVIERTIEDWQEWVTRPSLPELTWVKPDWWEHLVVIAEKPQPQPFPNVEVPSSISGNSNSLINPKPDSDWLVNIGTGLLFDDVLIGPTGRLEAEILTTDAAEAIAGGGVSVNANPGSGLASESSVVFMDTDSLKKSGLMQVKGGLNIVGRSGVNSALAKNFGEINRINGNNGPVGR